MDEHSFYPLMGRWEIADFNAQIENLTKSKFSPPIFGPPKFAPKMVEKPGIYVKPRLCLRSKFDAKNGENSEKGEESRRIFVDFKFFSMDWIVPPRWAAIRYEFLDAGNRTLFRREIKRSYLADVYQEFNFAGEPRQRFGDESLEIRVGRKFLKFAEPVVLNYRLVVWKTDPGANLCFFCWRRGEGGGVRGRIKRIPASGGQRARKILLVLAVPSFKSFKRF